MAVLSIVLPLSARVTSVTRARVDAWTHDCTGKGPPIHWWSLMPEHLHARPAIPPSLVRSSGRRQYGGSGNWASVPASQLRELASPARAVRKRPQRGASFRIRSRRWDGQGCGHPTVELRPYRPACHAAGRSVPFVAGQTAPFARDGCSSRSPPNPAARAGSIPYGQRLRAAEQVVGSLLGRSCRATFQIERRDIQGICPVLRGRLNREEYHVEPFLSALRRWLRFDSVGSPTLPEKCPKNLRISGHAFSCCGGSSPCQATLNSACSPGQTCASPAFPGSLPIR